MFSLKTILVLFLLACIVFADINDLNSIDTNDDIQKSVKKLDKSEKKLSKKLLKSDNNGQGGGNKKTKSRKLKKGLLFIDFFSLKINI